MPSSLPLFNIVSPDFVSPDFVVAWSRSKPFPTIIMGDLPTSWTRKGARWNCGSHDLWGSGKLAVKRGYLGEE
jgi:hypothetical protein